MTLRTLGLDLGVASIGWALIDEDGKRHELVKWGSRIFQQGIDDDSKGETPAAIRRQHRALRQQYSRRRERKEKLIAALVEGGLLTKAPDPAFFEEIDKRLLKTFPAEFRARRAHLIPYFYRKMALDRPLPPEELARALFHLAQRRGYQSNRKKEAKDEESGKVKEGIHKLKIAIQESGARTLGEYFSTVDPEVERIRTRYTDRSMYKDEFHKICQAQRTLISEELEKRLYWAIFHQRPLKSCKNLIGRCRNYPELPRCSFAKEEAQLFRIYVTVGNLRIDHAGTIRSLTEEERKRAIDFLNGFSPLFNKAGRIALSKLQKALGLAKGEKFTLADDEKEIFGNELKNILFRAFGERAQKLSETDRARFFNDLASIRKMEVLQRRLKEHWGLSSEVAEDVAGISMPDEHCAFSLKALREMLPDLEAGVPLPSCSNCSIRHRPKNLSISCR